MSYNAHGTTFAVIEEPYKFLKDTLTEEAYHFLLEDHYMAMAPIRAARAKEAILVAKAEADFEKKYFHYQDKAIDYEDNFFEKVKITIKSTNSTNGNSKKTIKKEFSKYRNSKKYNSRTFF